MSPTRDERTVVAIKVLQTMAAALSALELEVDHLFALIAEGVAGVTAAFLDSDRESARVLRANEQQIDGVFRTAEALARQELVSGGEQVEERLRFLLLVLQILPELERTGDLVEHIAFRASRGVALQLPPRCRGLIQQMGDMATDMWQRAADAYRDRAPGAAAELHRIDDGLDDLHERLVGELAQAS